MHQSLYYMKEIMRLQQRPFKSQYNNLMFQDIDQIRGADLDEQFGYITFFNHSFDTPSFHQLHSTEYGHQQEDSIFGETDLFDEPRYENHEEYCKNSAFKKKVQAFNEEYREVEKVQKSHKDTLKLVSKDIEAYSPHTIDQGESSSYTKERKLKAPKKLGKSNKKAQSEKDPYPTKNILPCFRSFFLNYIFEKSSELKSLEIIKRIQRKPCINLKDYEDLFNEPTLRPILGEYFRKNQLYRDLIQSRVQHKLKMIYLKKIPVFEEAFQLGVFKGIN